MVRLLPPCTVAAYGVPTVTHGLVVPFSGPTRQTQPVDSPAAADTPRSACQRVHPLFNCVFVGGWLGGWMNPVRACVVRAPAPPGGTG